MSYRPARPRILADKSLWPLYAILVLAVVLVGGRGCGPAPGRDGAGPATAVDSATRSSGQVVAGAGGGPTARGPAGSSGSPSVRSVAVCSVGRLPEQVQVTIDVIRAGSPLPPRGSDGLAFANRDRLLPPREAGYYREYQVPSQGSADGVDRRIVTGGGASSSPQEWYYTADPGNAFCRITGI